MVKISITAVLALNPVINVCAFETPLAFYQKEQTGIQLMASSYQPISFLRKNIFKFDSRVFATVKNTRSIISSPGNDDEVVASKNSETRKSNIKIIFQYVERLWQETAPIERRRIASQKATIAIKRVQQLMEGEEYIDFMVKKDDETISAFEARVLARDKMIEACNLMLNYVDGNDFIPDEDGSNVTPPNKKNSRSVLFGAQMGAITACWVFSGNYIFTALFTLITALGQLEYYRMVINTGIYPARKISVLGACTMFITALVAPKLHQICLPAFAAYAMLWFLTMRRKVTTISEIATTFTGMFYLGYIPSFWVRIRTIVGEGEPLQLAPIARPMLKFFARTSNLVLPTFLRKSVHLPITDGAIFIFWTWLSIAFADVGAYFFGKNFGERKLGDLAPGAGAASPNKTVEGLLGGTAVCALLATLGAWIQRWPFWFLIGPLHGIILAFLGLVGDLTASMFKRDAGLKDFGDLIPEHGGILDRVDSFIFTAPYSWLVCKYIVPTLQMKRVSIP